MAAAHRDGSIEVGALGVLALAGFSDAPTREQRTGALIVSQGLFDLHVLALGKNLKE